MVSRRTFKKEFKEIVTAVGLGKTYAETRASVPTLSPRTFNRYWKDALEEQAAQAKVIAQKVNNSKAVKEAARKVEELIEKSDIIERILFDITQMEAEILKLSKITISAVVISDEKTVITTPADVINAKRTIAALQKEKATLYATINQMMGYNAPTKQEFSGEVSFLNFLKSTDAEG